MLPLRTCEDWIPAGLTSFVVMNDGCWASLGKYPVLADLLLDRPPEARDMLFILL